MKAFLLPMFTCLVFPMLQSCGTPDTPDYECTPDITVPFPQDALDRFYFKTGTWWVYEEINNPGMEDSVWVENSYATSEIADPKDYGRTKTKKCYDYHHIEIRSDQFGLLACNFRIGAVVEGFDYDSEFFEVTKTGEMANNITTCIVSLDGNTYRTENCNKNLVSFEDSLVVKGNLFTNALKITKDKGVMDFLDAAYYVRNVGLVKYKRSDSSEWELIRYSIIQ
ncbi:MAG: hypothetical protein ACYC1Q_04430 [Bacteroidia bacterium]